MRRIVRVVAAGMIVLSAGMARAEDAKPAADASKEAAMKEVMQRGSPGEAHKALEPLVGNWTYTATMWMAADGQPETMSGTATNSLIYGGRFLKQETRGTMEGYPPFEGLGFTGYDNIRKEYQTVWLDSMSTSVMVATGQYDPAAKKFSSQGDFSCPMTGEAHRKYHDSWTIVDPNHATYESYSWAPDGKEYKAMEIHYTRAQ